MVLPPAELFLAGVIDMADQNGLQQVAVLYENQLFPRAAGAGAAELAAERGMNVVMRVAYESGATDFSPILNALRDYGAEVLAMAASNLDDFILVMDQMAEMDVNVQMFGSSGAVNQFRDALGARAEYAYGLSAWEPVLDNPGVPAFVAAYESEFGLEPSFHAAGAYGSCQLFAAAVQQTGSLDQEAIRDTLLALEMTTIFGDYAVDERGYQTANKGLIIQWQNGEKVVVWPDDVATASPRYPTPAWSDR
jgi:branched-chain amino acid transport system substrate-binding protein